MKKTLLLSLMLLGFNQIATSQIVFQENWDGAGPGITGWTLYNVDNRTPASGVTFVNAAWVATNEDFDNRVAMSTSDYNPVGAANDWLVSPSIAIPAGSSRLSWDAKAYGSAAYRDSYKVFISTTGNAVANFTTQLFVQGDGATGASGENNTWTRRSVDLSAYAGQNVYIAFQNFSNNMYLLGIDNINIVNNLTCSSPERAITNVINSTNTTISWTAVVGATGYDIAIGAAGFTPTTATATSATNSYTTTTPLTPNTRYQYYVRNSCGGIWVGPYSLFTPASLPYNYGFETLATNGGYFADGWVGAFSLNNTQDATHYADGIQMSFSNSSTTAATNRWLFSRPISLSAGEQVTLKFSTRSSHPTVNNTLLAKVGNATTIAAQTTTLATVTVVGTTFVETTATYTAPTAGVYYFSFNHNNAATSAATSIVLDKVVMTSVLSTNEFLASKLLVYPNPANDIVNISSDSNVLLNNLTITDLNGRVVKSVKLTGESSAQVNISDLSAGVYMMNIISDQGSTTKKIIKS